ncbi:hypothetical protein TWF506_002380 [Arthrobotrys conoides]|uniref:F-box domain-containing protein n=1 Tax=Arthrobotrys conoides TaxID=74498 RepID=A0AAN8N911_9PEZI
MPTLSSLPNEVFNEIVNHLPRKSQLLLRLCSKTLESKSDNDKLFRTQRYYHSAVDLKGLVSFSTDPVHEIARNRCKTLVLDTFSPRTSMKIRCKTQCEEGENGEKKMKTIAVTTDKLAGERAIGLLTTALNNLPNLEAVEVVTTKDIVDVPDSILQAHYPDLGFDIRVGKHGKWFKKAYRRAMEHVEVYPRENHTFPNILAAISQSTWDPKILRFPELTDARRWIWKSQSLESAYMHSNGLSLRWFSNELDNPTFAEGLQSRLRGVKKLELPLWIGDDEGSEISLNEVYTALRDARRGLTKVLEMVPEVEELRIKVGGLPRFNILDIAGTVIWHPAVFPQNPVDVAVLKFNNLRILSLFEQAFVEDELKSFLISHKTTLRRIELINCVLHSQQQLWSNIFNLLKSHLSLWSFEFHTEYPKITSQTSEQLRTIPWFRVYGNIRTPNHRCELFPKHDDSYKQENKHPITFDQALQVVTILEHKIVLENDPELNAEKTDIRTRLHLVRQGISPDNPSVQLTDPQIRLMLRQLSSRQFALRFLGIQPKDIKDELMALGVNGFEMENKAGRFGQFNSHNAAVQRRSESCFKQTVASTA